VHHNSVLIKIQLDATVCSLIYFIAKRLLSEEFLTYKLLRYFITSNFENILMYHHTLLSEVNKPTHYFVSLFQGISDVPYMIPYFISLKMTPWGRNM